MDYRFTLLPGDGIGPEVTGAALEVVQAAGVSVSWERHAAGAAALEAGEATPLPDAVLRSIERNRVALKGPITTPVGTGFSSVNVALRKALDLFASVRPVRSLPGVASRHAGVDLTIVRENTEGMYSGREHEVVPGVVETLRIVTRAASERIARFAFELARREGRRSVTVVHKASVLKQSDGLFLACCARVGQDYPFIAAEEVLIDNAAMRLVLAPERFEVLLSENLFGDLISDLCAGLVGGLGVVPGANIGERHAVFEAVHGSAPDIAGRGTANPAALILSAAMLLDHIGERRAAAAITSAVEGVLAARRQVTPDLGGRASTQEMTLAVIARLRPSGGEAGG
ncbi:MAG TPA: isocitrate/isopropylmalate dehydrogenase family protein [Candidatus Polarisedimenticolia bacterium]|nr:isocitrate/isopropylmalate dehydrogenase family protein [Candidatus Polarisedimenticolia bacterium]